GRPRSSGRSRCAAGADRSRGPAGRHMLPSSWASCSLVETDVWQLPASARSGGPLLHRITWLVTRSRDKVDHVRPALARLLVDGCLGTDPVLVTTHGQGAPWPVASRRRLLSAGCVNGQTRCLGRVEQALVISRERAAQVLQEPQSA